MKVSVRHQESYSRSELLLRLFFGWIYIILPHAVLLMFVGIAALFVNFISFWAILILGRFPRGMWNFLMNYLRWALRLNARMQNLSDGYPAFGLSASDENTSIEMSYPESTSRLITLARTLFGAFYVIIPHGICLLILGIAGIFARIIAWWIVLFTAKYPKGLHDFSTGLLRWNTKVNAYILNLTDDYPPFSLAEQDHKLDTLDQ